MEKIPALYNPRTGKIACVLLQAGCGGNSAIPRLFETEDWELSPQQGQVRLGASMDQWKMVAAMSVEKRIERWKW
ncbi:hypothetical protein ACEUZ9_000461 [Paracoccus litorisediminis]|uniref:hypothetical protein n=1 Tax=Paracoccus litorisediminis TaxID=2006130 RepID=UPI003730DFAA